MSKALLVVTWGLLLLNNHNICYIKMIGSSKIISEGEGAFP